MVDPLAANKNHFDKEQLRPWLQLAQIKKVKVEVKRDLLNLFGSAAEVLSASGEQLKVASLGKFTATHMQQLDQNATRIEQQLDLMEKYRIGVLPLTDAAYPSALKELNDAPLVLFYRGNTRWLNAPQIAIVGSRHASPGGRRAAHDFAEELSNNGITITSGLALGIDGEAHQGAIKGIGSTVAVVATGVDSIYPRQHQALGKQIVQHGIMVSEFPPGTPPTRNNFPRRNRLISGLSMGVLVVEAGIRSGSLITARLAGEQGRDLFAIPGSIHLPTTKGCHQLIRQGAKLVETTQDILEELPQKAAVQTLLKELEQPKGIQSNNSDKAIESDSQRLLNLVDFAPTSVDKLVKESCLAVETVSATLLQLELEGKIARVAGNRYQRIA